MRERYSPHQAEPSMGGPKTKKKNKTKQKRALANYNTHLLQYVLKAFQQHTKLELAV
jgi:hypothetical protein